MAENKYENQFCFVDSSIIISSYIINYYIIARYKVSLKLTLIHQLGLKVMSLKKLFLSFSNHDWNYNDTANTSAMCNIAHASTKQNYIV